VRDNPLTRHALLAALLLGLAISFAGLGSHSLWSPDEPTGAAVGRAMLDSGDLVVPRLNGEPFLEKPPLYWWVQVAAFRLFGVADAVARLPSAVFGLLTLLVTFALGRRLGGEGDGPRLGLLAAAVLAALYLFGEEIDRVVVDPALAFFVAVIHLGFVLLAEPRTPADRRRAWLLIAVSTSLAFLAKGVVALGLGIAPPVLWLLATRRLRGLRELAPVALLGVPLFALIVGPWAVALYRATGWPGIQECLLNNTSGRLLANQAGRVYGHRQTIWYYLTTGLAVLLPWSLALPAMLRAGVARRAPVAGGQARPLLFATFWIGVALLSAAASKRELYLLPLLPAFAVCVAWWLATRDARAAGASWDRRTLRVLLTLAAALPLLLWGAAAVVRWAPPPAARLAPLQAALSTGRLAGAGAAALAASGLLMAVLFRRWRSGPGTAWVLIPFLLLSLLAQAGLKALVEPVKGLHELTAAVRTAIPGPDPVVAYLPPPSSRESLFGIIGFDLGRRTVPLATPEELRAHLDRSPGARLVCRAPEARRLPPELRRRLRFLYDETGRKAAPYAIAERVAGD